MNPIPPHPSSPPRPPGATFLPSQPPNPSPQPSPPPPSLKAVLAELTSVIDHCTTTLNSLPAPILAAAKTANFVPCPFNPNHRFPPSSLFSHYLNCPTPLFLPHTFHYPHTLRPFSSTTTTTTPPPILPADSSDLTVSLEKYIGYNGPASFFYQNCPGPVTFSIQPPSSLNLPRFLYIECADFNEQNSLKGAMGFSVDFIEFLPSEIWVVQSEVAAWSGGFPAFYSSRVLRAIMKLKYSRLLSLSEWIIANSPRYGVIIDLAMRDHVVVLVKLCLKVIVREAFELAGVMLSNGELMKEEDFLPALRNRSFECPVLGKVLMWLSMQFSILYGEVNGKFFTVEMLKECISDTALRASLFPVEGKEPEPSEQDEVDKDEEEPVQSIASMDDTKRDGRVNIKGGRVGHSTIFISEVAAAVAALHERALIEEKIKALRYSQPLSAYQRNMEHAQVSKLADEERQKRPDYRPIIEHDGTLRQRPNNQGSNKVKTREELLAEERDYKRRRMSYRGKKQRRNTLEVMRDIIEEYMEEIKQTGGIGSTSKAVEETEALASENSYKHASGTDASGSRRNSETPEKNRGRSVDYRKDVHSRHYSGDFKDDNRQPRQDSTWDHGRQYANRNVESVRYDRDDHSRSQDGRQISIHAREQMYAREKQDFVDASAEDYSRRSHQRQNELHDRKYYRSRRDEHEQRTQRRERDRHERTSQKRERDEDNGEHRDSGRSKRDSAARERDEDKGGYAERKSKTNRKSSSRRELREPVDKYYPAESRDSYKDHF